MTARKIAIRLGQLALLAFFTLILFACGWYRIAVVCRGDTTPARDSIYVLSCKTLEDSTFRLP
jgi:ABC-type dipeptide/oligopeptide/nickel transport system permease subunit